MHTFIPTIIAIAFDVLQMSYQHDIANVTYVTHACFKADGCQRALGICSIPHTDLQLHSKVLAYFNHGVPHAWPPPLRLVRLLTLLNLYLGMPMASVSGSCMRVHGLEASEGHRAILQCNETKISSAQESNAQAAGDATNCCP